MSELSVRERSRRHMLGEITAIALRLFAERGYENVTVDEIAAEAGISSRTFFRYFATKDEVITQFSRRLVERLLDALAARPESEGAVTALRNAYVETSAVAPANRKAVVQQQSFMRSSRSLFASTLETQASGQDDVAALLATHMGLRGVDTRCRTIAAAMNAVAGAAFQDWVESGGKGDPSERVGSALDLLIHGLGALDMPAKTPRKASA
ncbi:MAG: TetR family transcriptional regulator [Acidimicrobiia bacterium]